MIRIAVINIMVAVSHSFIYAPTLQINFRVKWLMINSTLFFFLCNRDRPGFQLPVCNTIVENFLQWIVLPHAPKFTHSGLNSYIQALYQDFGQQKCVLYFAHNDRLCWSTKSQQGQVKYLENHLNPMARYQQRHFEVFQPQATLH